MTPEITAAWTTSGATILLALFAFLAWRASANSLKSMQNQERDSKRAAQAQVDDQNWGRQVEALAKYSSALRQLHDFAAAVVRLQLPVSQEVAAKDRSRAETIWREVEDTGLIWRMHHKNDEGIYGLFCYMESLGWQFRFALKGKGDWDQTRRTIFSLLEIIRDWQEDPAEGLDHLKLVMPSALEEE